jgi:hypothetical protein
LTCNDLCDHGGARDARGARKYTEAVVKADNGEMLVLQYHGLQQPPFEVARSDAALCKPYSRVVDWRYQLRIGTVLEVHRSLHPSPTIQMRKPVYVSDSGKYVMYRNGVTEEWWIGIKAEYDELEDMNRGYFFLPTVKSLNPLELNDACSKPFPNKTWKVWNDEKWTACPLLRINPVDGAGTLDDRSGYEGLPASVMVEGSVEHHAHVMGQYTWVPSVDVFEATCEQIDITHGVIDIEATHPAVAVSEYVLACFLVHYFFWVLCVF